MGKDAFYLLTFGSILQPDRMIKLEIGSANDRISLCVPERTLVGISTPFAEVLKTKLVVDEYSRHVLRLPDDNSEAWKILLYSQFAGSLPHMFSAAGYASIERAEHLVLLVHCWLLGEKYGALQFQDLIMGELIAAMGRTFPHPVPIALIAVKGTPGSKLWQFMVEEEAWRLVNFEEDALITHENSPTVAEDFGRDDIPRAFIDAVEAVSLDDILAGHERIKNSLECLRLMVDGGPNKTWLHVTYPFCDSHNPPEDDVESKGAGVGANDSEGSHPRRPTVLAKFCKLLTSPSK